MISIPRKRTWLSRKNVTIAVAGLLGFVVVAVGVWWAVAESAMGQYRQSLGNYKSSAASGLSSAIEKLKGETDTTKRLAGVLDLATTATKQARALPEMPKIFGITAGSDQDKTANAELNKRVAQFAADADMAQKLLTYQIALAKQLQELASKTGNNPDEQKALAAAWQTAINDLKGRDAPAPAKKAHANLIVAASDIQAILVTLPELYEKKDANGFAAKQSELQTKTGKLRELAGAFHDAAAAQDKLLAASYAAVLAQLE